jgi:uncharacterized protein YqeY
MHVLEQLEQDLAAAMRERDQIRLQVLRLLKSALKNYQIEVGHELSPQEMMQVLQKEAKKRRDSIEAYEKAGRDDLVAEESAELKEIQHYLPAQLSDDEVRAIVRDVVAANPDAQMGQIIGQVLAKTNGQADGGLVSRIVREELDNK